jgi:N-acetylmuramoyl-L-alanine amidase
VHHTATAFGVALPGTGVGNLLINGRSDLSGPLCNYAGNDDGSITVIAAHPANHAGASGGRSMGPLPTTTRFNRLVLGLEIVYPGTTPMRPAQYRAALVWANAVAKVCGRGDIQRVRAHAETSVTGKWDPGEAPGRTINMTAFRNAARNLEDDLTPEEHRWLKFVHDRVAGILPQRYYLRDSTGRVREVSGTTPGAVPAHVLDTLDGNSIIQRIAPLLDDEANIIAAVQRLQASAKAEDEEVTPEQVESLAEALSVSIPRDLVDHFDTTLRAAYDRDPES